MRPCVLILVILLLNTTSLSAEENAGPVKNRPTLPSTGEKQQSKSNRQTSSPHNTSSQVVKPTPNEPKPDQKDKSHEQQPQQPTKWWQEIIWSGWAQVFVAAFGLYFLWRTLLAVETQSRAAKEAAEAALEEAKAITLSEKAYVFAKVDMQAGYPLPIQNGMTAINALALFVNHGKTPAIISNMTGGLHVTGAGISDIPREFPDAPNDERIFSEGWVIASEGTFQLPLKLIIPESEMDEIRRGTKALYGVGWIKYKDILGNKRETGYCWEYLQTPSSRFKFCYASKLNYFT